MKPFINDLMNATGLAFDPQGMLYISSRYDGFVYQVTPNGNMSVFVEGMGVATGLAFDGERNLYVGDRSGTSVQSQSEPPDFRLRHDRAFHRRLSPGLRPGWLLVRDRPHDFQLRLPSIASRRRARSRFSTAGLAGRRAWPSTRKAAST